MGDFIRTKAVDEGSHLFSASLDGPLNPPVSNFERGARHHAEIHQRAKKTSATG